MKSLDDIRRRIQAIMVDAHIATSSIFHVYTEATDANRDRIIELLKDAKRRIEVLIDELEKGI